MNYHIVTSPRVWGGCESFPIARNPAVLHPHACGADARAPLPPGTPPVLHPHACGADSLLRRSRVNVDVTSPRVWGG